MLERKVLKEYKLLERKLNTKDRGSLNVCCENHSDLRRWVLEDAGSIAGVMS